jgi:hypothetical protein
MVAVVMAQMKTDAYTKCRGAGRIADNVSLASYPGQAMNTEAVDVTQRIFSC